MCLITLSEGHWIVSSQVLVGRGERIPEGPQGPVIVCTRNDALDDVVSMTPPDRKKGESNLVWAGECFADLRSMQRLTMALHAQTLSSFKMACYSHG